jgi:hypothetical protein
MKTYPERTESSALFAALKRIQTLTLQPLRLSSRDCSSRGERPIRLSPGGVGTFSKKYCNNILNTLLRGVENALRL